MPELPEVETIRRDLTGAVLGKSITAVFVFSPDPIRQPSPEAFASQLPGHRIEKVERRGKFLILRLSGGCTWVVHLMLEGQLVEVPESTPLDGLTKIAVQLEDGNQLRLRDLVGFARTFLFPTGEEESLFREMGPEPLSPEFTCDCFLERLKHRTGMIKPLLLDQKVLSGVGNIYADEALFRARIHPKRKVSTLSHAELCRLHQAIVAVLREGIEHRGTTASRAFYRDLWGQKGHHQDFLQVFRKKGQPCPGCPGTIEEIRVGGRSTFFCPSCQKLAEEP